MRKRILILFVACLCFLTACGKTEKEEVKNADAIKFKEDYESLNGKKNAKGLEHRTVSISEDNPYVFSSSSEILSMIDKKESFYVYFGDKQCPWCRSAIEKSIEVAKKKGIKKIYYVHIWDDEHNEILRDTYTLNDKGKAELSKSGTDDYYSLLKAFDSVLSDYVLTSEDNKEVKVGEKRIYAPNFIYVEDGVAKEMVEGTSDSQSDSRMELTEELLKEEEEIFTNFFTR